MIFPPGQKEFTASVRKPLGGFLFLLRWRGRSRLFRQQLECGRIFHSYVGQDFAVKIHAGGFQPMNQLPVGDAVQSRGGPDALDPQSAILPFFYAPIAECIAICAIGSFLRGLVQLALGEKKTFCALEILLPPRTAFCAAFYACHLGFSLIKWETTGCADAQEHAYGNGFVSGRTAEPRMFTARRTLMRLVIGRQAPVKRCLARCRFAFQRNGASLRSTFSCYCISFDRLRLKFFARQFSLSVRKQELHVQPVRGAHQRELLQLAHATGFLGAEQMAFPRMHAKDFTCGSDLEAFLSAAVRLQLHLGLGTIPWHL
jgi:hypothetical protein